MFKQGGQDAALILKFLERLILCNWIRHFAWILV